MDRYPSLSYNQMFGFLAGGVYLAVGLAGFAATGGLDFAGTTGASLLEFFKVNPLHNVAHLLVGGLLLGAALVGAKASRGVNLLVGVVYLGLAAAGPFVVGTDANILALNVSDHLLHLGTGLVAIFFATVIARQEAQADTWRQPAMATSSGDRNSGLAA